VHSSNAPTARRGRGALLVVAIALLCAPATALGSPAGDDASRLYELTNQARAQQGLPALAYDDAAAGVAQSWAAELARSGNLRHNPNLVADVDAHVTRDWTRVGENVGYAGSADQVQAAYMSSPGHRANILGSYNRVGIGTVRDGAGRLWTTVVFLQGPPIGVASSTFAPFASAQAFATQQFVELLNRPPDPSGLSEWTSALQSGRATPAGMIASLATSPESSVLVDPVNRLYWGYFDRIPDAGGVQHWVGRLRTGTTLGQISAVFAGSPEFVATYGSLRDDAFVDLVYRNVLRREPDAYGKAYWLAQLTTRRVDRGGMMVSFTESPEFKSDSAAWNSVVEIYVGMLRRAPDDASLHYWSTQLRGGRPLGDLTATVLTSAEYRGRFQARTG
jgi:uncharacterized protein YkwD